MNPKQVPGARTKEPSQPWGRKPDGRLRSGKEPPSQALEKPWPVIVIPFVWWIFNIITMLPCSNLGFPYLPIYISLQTERSPGEFLAPWTSTALFSPSVFPALDNMLGHLLAG